MKTKWEEVWAQLLEDDYTEARVLYAADVQIALLVVEGSSLFAPEIYRLAQVCESYIDAILWGMKIIETNKDMWLEADEK